MQNNVIFLRKEFTPYELQLLKTLGEVACELYDFEDKITKLLTPIGVAIESDMSYTVLSKIAEKCTTAMCQCVPVEERVGDEVFAAIFEKRDVDRAIALLAEYIFNQ